MRTNMRKVDLRSSTLSIALIGDSQLEIVQRDAVQHFKANGIYRNWSGISN